MISLASQSKDIVALTIAGSDSSGGAGIQADLKTFAALKVYGASVVTVLTAQNTVEIRASEALAPDFIEQQIDAVCEDMPVKATKIGMLGNSQIISTVASALSRHRPGPLILDPVLTATTGKNLLDSDGLQALREQLLPRTKLLTPNLYEAGILAGTPTPHDEPTMRTVARALAKLGPAAVLLKGGHLGGGQCVDILWDGKQFHRFAAARHPSRNTHGTGCTLSAAITALLARGLDLVSAVADAKAYLNGAIAHADTLAVGKGSGPLQHFWSHPPG